MIRRGAAILALLAACAFAAHADELITRTVGDRPATLILRTMLSATPEGQRLGDVSYIAGYEVIGKSVAIPPAAAEKLAALVKNPAAFERPAENEKPAPDTLYRPGVAYRFGTDKGFVDLLVCFSCDKIAIVPMGSAWIAAIRDVTQPARDVLLGVAKELLPGDEALQALPRVRSKSPAPPPPAPVPADAPKPGDDSSPEK